MITASANDLTLTLTMMITASANDLTLTLTMGPGASGVCGAWQQGAGEEASAQHNRERDGTTLTSRGS